MTQDSSVPYRPLGLLKELTEAQGLQITHSYEDLVFIEHNAFLFRMEEKGEDVSLIFNVESDPDKREEITTAFVEAGKGLGLHISPNGTYKLVPDEETSSLQIEFIPHS